MKERKRERDERQKERKELKEDGILDGDEKAIQAIGEMRQSYNI